MCDSCGACQTMLQKLVYKVFITNVKNNYNWEFDNIEKILKRRIERGWFDMTYKQESWDKNKGTNIRNIEQMLPDYADMLS